MCNSFEEKQDITLIQQKIPCLFLQKFVSNEKKTLVH